jgi:hypothetical protein
MADSIIVKYTGKEINEFIDLFSKINPSHDQLFKRKNQREAMERLLKKMGKDKVQDILEIIVKTNNMQYAPVITTPMELEGKLGHLISFINRKNLELEKNKIKEL